MREIILASGSPRRKELLEQIKIPFTVDAGNGEDPVVNVDEPHKFAVETSRRKAEALGSKYPDALLIAADTIGYLEGRIIGKPHSKTDARTILSDLRGKPHKVITGLTVLDTKTRKSISRSVETTVYIKNLTDREIDAYIATGEPMDKAGAYAIQGLGAVIVEKIEGDYANVIGLPLFTLVDMLKECGVTVL